MIMWKNYWKLMGEIEFREMIPLKKNVFGQYK